MRGAGHDEFRPKPASGLSRCIELCKGRKTRRSAVVTIGIEHVGKMNSRGADVRRADLKASKVVIDSGGISSDVAVAEVPVDRGENKELYFVAGRHGRQI